MDSIQQQRVARKQIPVLQQEIRLLDKILLIFGVWWLADLIGRIIFIVYLRSLSVQESIQFGPIYETITVWYLDPVMFVMGPVIFSLLLLKLVLWKRASGGVRKADYSLCIFCKYPLAGIGEVGSCPECGKSFDIEETQRLWRTAIDTPKPTSRSL